MQFVIVNCKIRATKKSPMKHRRQDLIYIYDTDRQKIIMIDGETGEQVDEEDDQVTSFLKYLHKEGKAALLRKFAVWCTRQINKKLKPIQKKIIDLAEEAIRRETDAQSLRELYEETEGTAIATDTVGLRQGNENAPAYLSARECINPDPLEGAIQAARFHRLWAEMQSEEDDISDLALQEIKAGAAESEIQQVEQKQTDYLLDLMNEWGILEVKKIACWMVEKSILYTCHKPFWLNQPPQTPPFYREQWNNTSPGKDWYFSSTLQGPYGRLKVEQRSENSPLVKGEMQEGL